MLACAGALAVRLLAEMEGLTPTEVARIVRGLKDCVAVAAAVLEEQLDGDALLSLIRHGTLELIGATGLQVARIEGAAVSLQRGLVAPAADAAAASPGTAAAAAASPGP